MSSTIGEFIAEVSKRLDLTWVAGFDGTGHHFTDNESETSGQTLVGPLNLIHPNRIQIIGHTEIAYINSLLKTTRKDTIHQLFNGYPAIVICTNDIEVPTDLIDVANETSTPLLRTQHSDQRVLNNLQYYLSQELAERETIHGVFMEVLGLGILLTGTAASGKSELALELLNRGHRLIADDAPEFARIAPDIVTGSCPPLLQDFIEVRGLGLLNVRRMFGDTAIKRGKYLRLIVHLAQFDNSELAAMDRLAGVTTSRTVLGLKIPQVTVPIAPGRNMAVLVETAVRHYLLRLQGYDASEDFIERQRTAIENASAVVSPGNAGT
jgi:HPr kinase/phosphorylase